MKKSYLSLVLPTLIALSGCNTQFSANVDGETYTGTISGGGAGGTLEDVDLALRLEGNSTDLEVGDTLLYTLIVSNDSADAASGVVTTLPLPEGVTYSGNNSLCETQQIGDIETLICRFASIGGNSQEQVLLPLIAKQAGEARLAATVVSSQSDSNRDNNSQTVQLSINNCAPCKSTDRFALSWDANAEVVLGYNVYYGPNEQNTTQFVTKLDANNQPQVTMAAWQDLQLMAGDNVCFRVTAFNDLGESGKSDAICARAS